MEKPSQTTIHPDDVEALVRDFDKKPEPNPHMVEAHRKAREAFAQPMSKPSEKATGYAAMGVDWLVARVEADDRLHHQLMECASNNALFRRGQTMNGYNSFQRIAEALSEHKRVLRLAYGALEGASLRLQGAGMLGGMTDPVQHALAAIAELKTNEKPLV